MIDVQILNHEFKLLRGRVLNARMRSLASSKVTLESTEISAVAFAGVDNVLASSGAILPFGAGPEATS